MVCAAFRWLERLFHKRGSIPHGVELSTGGPEEPAASISEGVGGDLWYDHFL